MNNHFKLGKPLNVIWHFKRPDGENYSLAGLQHELVCYNSRGRFKIKDSVINVEDTGVLSFTLKEEMQTVEGAYSFYLSLLRHGKTVNTVVKNDAIILSKHIIDTDSIQEDGPTTIDIFSVGEFELFRPTAPVAGSDGWWYFDGQPILDDEGNKVPINVTIDIDDDPESETFGIITLDKGRDEGRETVITGMSNTITAAIQATESTNAAAKYATEKGDYAKEQGNYAKEQGANVADLKNKVAEYIKNYKPVVINGNVNNAPDEEDITSNDENLLQFKNRSTLNGMGYIILRKNKPFAEQLTQSNTIYEIRYDFDLDGQEITIPEGCVLDFQGGSLRNGTIIGQVTKLSGKSISIFNNVDIDGTWDVPMIRSSMFADIHIVDKLNILLKLTNNEIVNHIYIDYGQYVMTPTRSVWPPNNGLFIYQKENIVIHNLGDICIADNNLTEYNVICCYQCKNISIEGGTVSGDKINHEYSDNSTHEWGHGISILDSINIKIDRCEIKECTGDGIYINIASNIILTNIEIANCRRQGISIVNSVDNVTIDGFNISGISGTAPASGIDIEPNISPLYRGSRNITIKNGTIKQSNIGVNFYYPKDEICYNLSVDNLFIEDIKEMPLFFQGVEMLKLSNIVFSQNTVVPSENDFIVRGSDIINMKISSIIINAPEWNGFYITGANNGFVHISDSIINVKALATLNSRATIETSNITVSSEHILTQYILSRYAYPVRFIQCSINIESAISPTIRRCQFENCEISLYGTYTQYKVFCVLCKLENVQLMIKEYSESQSIVFSEGSFFDNIAIISANSIAVSYLIVEASDSLKSTFGNITFSEVIKLKNGQNFLYPQGRSFRLLRNEAANSGNTDNRPKGLANFCSAGGFNYYDFTLNRPIWWTGTKWIDAIGREAIVSKGKTTERPSLGDTNDGFEYYDTDLDMPIYWDTRTQRWLGADGFTAGYHKGDDESRPTLTLYDQGFTYWDVFLNKLIVWNGNAWVDSNGAEV